MRLPVLFAAASFVAAVAVPTVAHAAFRSAVPSSMRLIDTAAPSAFGRGHLHLIGDGEDDADPGYPTQLTPPPLVPAPGGEAAPATPPKAAPPRATPPRASQRLAATGEIPMGTRLVEILLAGGAVAALDVLALGTLFAGVVFTLSGQSSVGVGVVLIVIAVLEELILPPVVAALGVSLATNRREEGGFGRAMLWGFAVHGAMLVILIAASAISSVAGGNSVSQVVVPMAGLLTGFVHLVGIPLAASFGYHDRRGKKEEPLRAVVVPTGSDRVRTRVLQSPTDRALAERQRAAVPLAAFAF